MRNRAWAAAGVAVVAAVPVGAQVAPPAQVLQRNPTVNPDRINEEQRQRSQQRINPEAPPPRTPEVEAPPPAAVTESTAPATSFTLTAVRFDPSSYLTQSELQALAQPLIGTEVTLADLQRIVDRVNALYAERGLTTARAALPAQQIDGGTVQIRLIEGRIGATTAEGGSPRGRRYAERAAALPAGTLAAPGALEQQLRLFNANNDAQLRARLTPGTTFGTTDVALAVTEPARLSGDLFVDNNGFASTGTAEVGLVLRAFRLFGGADRASLVVVKSAGVLSSSVSLSAPIGPRLRIGASGSYGRTEVKYGPLAALGVTGSSYSFGADAAALLAIGDRFSLTGNASIQTSLSRTEIGGARVIDNNALNGSLGLTLSYAGPGFSGVVQTQATLAHVNERLSLTEVNPVLFGGSLQLAKLIAPRVQARVRGDWQVATSSNLPGIVQYQIGGTRSARAFDPGVAAGDSGFSVSGELAYGLTWDGLQIEPMVFVDHAQVAAPGQKVSVQAAGAGLNLSFAPHIFVRGTVATDIGRSTGVPRSTRAFVSTTFRF